MTETKLNIQKRMIHDKLSAIKWLEENEQKYIISHIDGITAHRPTVEPSGLYGKIEKFNLIPVVISLEERTLAEWDIGIHRDSLAVREFVEKLQPIEVHSEFSTIKENISKIIPSLITIPSRCFNKMEITFLF